MLELLSLLKACLLFPAQQLAETPWLSFTWLQVYTNGSVPFLPSASSCNQIQALQNLPPNWAPLR